MCGITNVAGATGGGPPMKADVAGANGGGASLPNVQGGGAGDALAGAIAALGDAVKQLTAVVQALKGGQVLGVQGTAATKTQFVAKQASTTSTGNKEDDDFEQRVLELINQERAKYGLSALRYNGTLDNAAEKHNEHMAIVGKMAHDGIGDGDPGERIRAEGWRNAWGENVATGQTSPEQVVREWMNSPDHRRNILDPNFTSMGVAYTTASNGRTYWAQEFGA